MSCSSCGGKLVKLSHASRPAKAAPMRVLRATKIGMPKPKKVGSTAIMSKAAQQLNKNRA